MADDPHEEDEIAARKAVAGRFGFVLGCIAAIIAAIINLVRLPRWSPVGIALALLMAALNVPLGIIFGLVGERMSRGDRRPPRRPRPAVTAPGSRPAGDRSPLASVHLHEEPDSASRRSGAPSPRRSTPPRSSPLR